MSNSSTGWKFPVEIDPQTGKFKTISDGDDVKEAIRIILTTKKGERVNNPLFGSDLFKYVFTSLDYTEIKGMEYEIVRSINRWEPRIKNLNVNVSKDPMNTNQVMIDISYQVDEAQIAENIQYLFDLDEGLK